MVRDRGLEPLTPSVSRKCSTTELTARPMSKDISKLFAFKVFHRQLLGAGGGMLAEPDTVCKSKVRTNAGILPHPVERPAPPWAVPGERHLGRRAVGFPSSSGQGVRCVECRTSIPVLFWF